MYRVLAGLKCQRQNVGKLVLRIMKYHLDCKERKILKTLGNISLFLQSNCYILEIIQCLAAS